MNLLVVLAACEGINLIESMQPVERAPFAMLIGPMRVVYDGEIERGCLAFYKTLFSSRDGGAALRAMNDSVALNGKTFSSVPARAAFTAVFRRYFAELCTEEALAEREQAIVDGFDLSQMSHVELAYD
jgi:hypothetical protein